MLLINSPRARTHEHEMQSGFALVAVLGLILIISAVLLPFSTSARLRALTADNALRTFRYERIGEVLTRHVAEKIAALTDRGFVDLSRVSTAPACLLGEYSITLEMQDHAGLIDLNAAGVALLDLGFQALGFPKEKAASLARATDHYRRLDQRSDAGLTGDLIGESGYKHAAFEDVVELQDFVDLQQISPAVIASIFTVQSRSGTLSSDTAPDAIKKVAASQPNNALPFVVSSSRPRVITIIVDILRRENLESSSAAMFRLSGDKVVYAGSLPRFVDASETRPFSGQKLPCGEMIDEPILAALGEVLR